MTRVLLGLAAFAIVGGLVVASAQGASSQMAGAAPQAPAAAPAAPAQPRVPGGNMPGHDLVVYGDLSIFLGPGKPENCVLRSRYKRGEPVGFRADAWDRDGKRIDKETSELVVHLEYAGRTQDIKMRYRATAREPERQFWVAKWIVPADVPVGIVRYTITAKDAQGHAGLFKPFEVDASQLTIVE